MSYHTETSSIQEWIMVKVELIGNVTEKKIEEKPTKFLLEWLNCLSVFAYSNPVCCVGIPLLPLYDNLYIKFWDYYGYAGTL